MPDHSTMAKTNASIDDSKLPPELQEKVRAGFLPFQGRWLKRDEILIQYRKLKQESNWVLFEVLLLMLALFGTGVLAFLLLDLLCCS